jgi:hypothetical protein
MASTPIGFSCEQVGKLRGLYSHRYCHLGEGVEEEEKGEEEEEEEGRRL